MKVYADFRQEVEIDSKDVINNLIENQIGFRGWIFEIDEKYYRGYWSGGGTHSWKDSEEISKEKYEYIQALNLVLNYLSDDK